MEDNSPTCVLDGELIGIRFGMATRQEICTASISDSTISHASQLSNPFLGLPLEFGRCESCGTSEAGKCEGHFGYIELPVPIYHPSHIAELKRMLSLVCLNCLKMKKTKFPAASNGVAQKLLSSCCQDANASLVSIQEVKTTDGACYLALKVPKSKMQDGFWRFLEKYGYRYEGDHTRALLPCEVMEIIKRIPVETRKKLAGKGYFPQDGYVLKYLPVPPNCLSVPVVSDGISVMSSDPSMTILRKLLRKVEIIKSSRSGEPNFESHQVEANDLQSVVDQYLQVRGTSKAARDIETHFGVNKELSDSSTKAWLEKMRTLFIRKGSGFSSRSVITGDAYKRINQIGIPVEVAQRITFEERVNVHNMTYLQKLVDENLCLTYKEGVSTYSLREGSKGHIYLKLGQIVHRRIMDGDIVFINRPPTTHKHSLQALAVYIHDDHTVKINPLICGPLGADFDGDCIHLFYPQSLAAKAEVLELFSVEKQLLSSHSGNLNIQLSTESLLSLKLLLKTWFLNRAAAHQLAMFLSQPLPQPALLKANSCDSYWTALQMLQCALPPCFDCTGGRYLIRQSEILEFDFNRDVLPTMINEIAASIFFGKGPEEALRFFDVIQPFLMESLFVEGFSVDLQDFSISGASKRNISRCIRRVSPLLYRLRSSIYNELVEQQLEKDIQDVELPIIRFALKSKLGDLIDPKSRSAINKVVQQIGFLGLQLSDRGRFYTKTLVEDVASHFHGKCFYSRDHYPSAEYGLLKGCFFNGLDPFEEIVHSISTREIIVRSSRGLAEPGTLFKNLMAILRDVVICYDGTVRNVCSNSVIQFEYGTKAGDTTQLFPAGEPVGVLAATSMSNPAYKAVLDASPSSNSSWELMKEILLCKVNFRNEPIDRRVILYLNDCGCGRSYCQENAACLVENQLRKVSLKDAAVEFIIEYQRQRTHKESSEIDAGLIGHIHLNEKKLKDHRINMADVLPRCQERLNSFNRKKKVSPFFKRTELFFSEFCSFSHSSPPCVTFLWRDGDGLDLDKTANILADIICPVLLETVIKGDPRISSASIIWVTPDTNTWVPNPCKSPKGELALDIILEKAAVKQSGYAWRIVLDSCLPVLHLIDTRRSIPYAIKQVQELLGISCTFDQAIQRLSSSVKRVAKGVLREHLILLASSMTCGGNLVGFNTGGYKALARQLNIQVPFTDATLFTPRKCFERAAEKCHMDSLSSVVASCSWGKSVAVGTGSRFDIQWDAREVKSDEVAGIDVYSFLHMVKSLNNEEVENNECLGEDVDDLLEEENADWAMSPQHTSGFDAVFEDNPELLNGSIADDWEANTDQRKTKSDDWSTWATNKADIQDGSTSHGWEANTDQMKAKPNDWSGWATSKADIQDGSTSQGWKANSDQMKTKSNDWSGWATKKADIRDEPDVRDNVTHKDSSRSKGWEVNTDQMKAKSNDWSGWVTSKADIQDGLASRGWEANTEQMKTKSNDSSGWAAKKADIQDESDVRDNVTHKDSSWSKGWNASTERTKSKDRSVWARDTVEKQDRGMGKAKSKDGADVIQGASSKSSGWERRPDSVGGFGFGKNDGRSLINPEPETSDWIAKVYPNKENDSVWDAKLSVENSSWAKPKSPKNRALDSQNKSNQAASSHGWDSQITPANADSGRNYQWGKQGREESSKKNHSEGSQGWVSNAGSQVLLNPEPATSNWDAKAIPNTESDSAWGAKSLVDSSSWGKPKSPENRAWESQNKSNQAASSHGWDSQITPADTDSGRNYQWGKQGREESSKKNHSEGSQGWGSNAGSQGLLNPEPATSDWDAKAIPNKESDSAWGVKSLVDSFSWGKPESPENRAWDSQNKSNQAASSHGWDSQITPASADSGRNYQWGKQGREESSKKNHSEGSQGWGSNAGSQGLLNPEPATSDWDAKAIPNKESDSVWGAKSPAENSSWGKPKSPENRAWDSQNESNQAASSQGWDSQIASANADSDSNFQWGKRGRDSFKKNRFEGSQGRGSNAGDRKNMNRPPRAPGPRLDLYTPEEQDVLKDIDPIQQSIRRIMQQPGYNDGDPLPADDQLFVLENVFEHHPDKEAKMGVGIDHVMVSRHREHQDSRCFYVVLKDGQREDFSYRKCLENLVKTKYPDVAESFSTKYFRKPRGSGDQAPTPVDQASTPVEQAPTPVTTETNE